MRLLAVVVLCLLFSTLPAKAQREYLAGDCALTACEPPKEAETLGWPEWIYQKSGNIILAQVVEARIEDNAPYDFEKGQQPHFKRITTLKVEKVWKGDVPETLTLKDEHPVRSVPSPFVCMDLMWTGNWYVLFFNAQPDEDGFYPYEGLATAICTPPHMVEAVTQEGRDMVKWLDERSAENTP